MREETVTYKLYKYDELSEKAKEKVMENFYDINVSFDWWDSSYDWFHEQLKDIGLSCKTFYFDLDRSSYVEAKDLHFEDVTKFVRSIDEKVKQSIIDAADLGICHHNGRQGWDTIDSGYSIPDRCPKLQSAVDSLIDRCNEKLKDVLENFRITLQRESEYLTSREAIEETIRCNDYEFLESGEIYR